MSFKFEKLEVWQRSLEYLELIYKIAAQLPKSEDFNVKSQIVRAATSINLNIAEGSTGQSDAEQSRFLGMAIRSLFETVSCQYIIYRLNYLQDKTDLREAYDKARILSIKIHNMRNTIAPGQPWIREDEPLYLTDSSEDNPFI